jgi:hypothetical protein
MLVMECWDCRELLVRQFAASHHRHGQSRLLAAGLIDSVRLSGAGRKIVVSGAMISECVRREEGTPLLTSTCDRSHREGTRL